jgi:hypothetical protein
VEEAAGSEVGGDAVHGRAQPRVVGREDPPQEQRQRGGVELVAAVRLGEGAEALVIAAVDHLAEDGVPRAEPGIDRRRQAALPREAGPAVQRHPAERPRVDEVPRAAADIPDPLVRLAPGGAHSVHHGAQEAPQLPRDHAAVLVQQEGAVEHLAVDVVLTLGVGRVPHPNQARGAVAFEVRQLELLDGGLIGHPVEHLDGGRVPLGDAEHPG